MTRLETVIASRYEVVAFVAGRREEDRAGEFVRYLKGSFSLSICVKFNDGGPNAIIIRFPNWDTQLYLLGTRRSQTRSSS